MAESIVYEKSKSFAIRAVNLYKYLCNDKKEYVMSKQLLRSATSIGANLAESNYAPSKRDFVHKIYLSLKEAAETKYWLEILYETNYLENSEFDSLNTDCSEIITILNSITKTMNPRTNK